MTTYTPDPNYTPEDYTPVDYWQPHERARSTALIRARCLHYDYLFIGPGRSRAFELIDATAQTPQLYLSTRYTATRAYHTTAQRCGHYLYYVHRESIITTGNGRPNQRYYSHILGYTGDLDGAWRMADDDKQQDYTPYLGSDWPELVRAALELEPRIPLTIYQPQHQHPPARGGDSSRPPAYHRYPVPLQVSITSEGILID